MKLWSLSLLFAIGCMPAVQQPSFVAPPTSRQVILVEPNGNVPNVTITAWSRIGDAWTKTLGPFPGVVGSAGVAPMGEKREGDKRAPGGTFSLGPAFGYEPWCDTGLEYRQATANDYWIDESASPDYNRWVQGKKPSCSHEILRRADDQYRIAAIIGYNLDPVVPGRGSAIFLHNWKERGHGTDGCVALDAEHVATLLRWLDRRSAPVVVILTK